MLMELLPPVVRFQTQSPDEEPKIVPLILPAVLLTKPAAPPPPPSESPTIEVPAAVLIATSPVPEVIATALPVAVMPPVPVTFRATAPEPELILRPYISAP